MPKAYISAFADDLVIRGQIGPAETLKILNIFKSYGI